MRSECSHAIVRRNSSILIALSAMPLVLRLLPLLRPGDRWTILDDSNEYLALARGLNSGCGFAHMLDGVCRSPELLRLPGYPVFVATMPSLRSVIVVQALVGAATCLIIGFATSARWGLAAGIIAEAILTLDIPSIVASSTIMSDCIFEATIAAAVVIQLSVISGNLTQRRSIAMLLLAAGILACSVMLRAVGIVLPLLAAAPFMLLRNTLRRRLALSAVAIAIPLLAVFGWSARNYVRTGRYTFNTEGDYTAYYYNSAAVLWLVNGGNLTQLQYRLAHEIGANGPDEYVSADQQREMLRGTLGVFARHPIATIVMGVRCFLWLAVVPDRANLNALLRTHARSSVFLIASQDLALRVAETFRSPLLTAFMAFQFVIIILLWVGVGMTLLTLPSSTRTERRVILFLGGVALFVMLVGAGPGAVARFRLPAMPFLAMLSGVGWSEGIARRSHLRCLDQTAENFAMYSILHD
jgi:hypothetical protein